MTYKCKHFGIKELVSKTVYNFYQSRYGEAFIWSFFDEDILKDLDTIREEWGKSIIINNWAFGGSLSQCGLRANVDPMVKGKTSPYLSGHCLAKGFDLHDQAGDNKGLYNLVCRLIKEGKLKKFKRVENFVSTPTWVHTDALQTPDGKLQIFSI